MSDLNLDASLEAVKKKQKKTDFNRGVTGSSGDVTQQHFTAIKNSGNCKVF